MKLINTRVITTALTVVTALCWQPAKLGHFETREIRGRIEV